MSSQGKAAFFLDPPPAFSMEYVQQLLTFTYSCFDQIMANIDRSARAKWKDHVNGQLAIGGGSLFKYVSMNEKSYLTVGVAGGPDCSPSKFVMDEHNKWSALWNPEDMQPAQIDELMGELNKINELDGSAKDFDGIIIDFDNF